MPTLISKYKSLVLKNQFQSVYSDLNNAAKQFQFHNEMSLTEYAYSTNGNSASILFQKEFNVIEQGITKKWPVKPRVVDFEVSDASCDASLYFVDKKGRFFAFDDRSPAGKNGPKICVDINGYKGPNTLGIDTFMFIATTDGLVIPYGMSHKNNNICQEYYSYACVVPGQVCSNSGYYSDVMSCAYYASIDKHPSVPGKDYWNDFINGK